MTFELLFSIAIKAFVIAIGFIVRGWSHIGRAVFIVRAVVRRMTGFIVVAEMALILLASDAHRVCAGEFLLTHTHTRKKPVPWPWVQDPAANLTGCININYINYIKYLIINKGTLRQKVLMEGVNPSHQSLKGVFGMRLWMKGRCQA